MEKGKVGDALVGFIQQFVGHIKGGIGAVTIVACGVFGAISGSSTATLSAIGSVMAPKLKENGYPAGLSAAIIANASVLGLLIPPSAAQILYAWSGGQSVTACFLATVLPGIILIILFSVIQYFLVRKSPTIIVSSKMEFSIKKSIYAFPALLMPFIILGGIYTGIMTPTEAAAIAVLYCIPVGFYFYKGITKKNFFGMVFEAANITGAVMLMAMFAMLFARLMIVERVPDRLLNLLLLISSNKYILLIMVNIVMIFCGMLMDDASAILICTPLLLPIVTKIGVHPIHFAAILGVNLGMGLVTPPVAPMLYFGAKIGNANVSEMLSPNMKFIIFAWIPTLILTTLFPQLALTLPRLILGIK